MYTGESNDDDKKREQRPPDPSSEREKKKNKSKKKRNEEQTELQNTFCTDTCNEHPAFRCIFRRNLSFPVSTLKDRSRCTKGRKGECVLKRNGQRYFADVRLKGWRYRCVACWKRVIKSDNALYRRSKHNALFSFFSFLPRRN